MFVLCPWQTGGEGGLFFSALLCNTDMCLLCFTYEAQPKVPLHLDQIWVRPVSVLLSTAQMKQSWYVESKTLCLFICEGSFILLCKTELSAPWNKSWCSWVGGTTKYTFLWWLLYIVLIAYCGLKHKWSECIFGIYKTITKMNIKKTKDFAEVTVNQGCRSLRGKQCIQSVPQRTSM